MAVEFEAELDLSELEEFFGNVRAIGRELVRVVTLDVWGGWKSEAPVDEGRLANSARVSFTGELEGRVGTNVFYAPFVAQGTGIYGPRKRPIVPVRARMLRWVDKQGNEIFARQVRGQKPNDFPGRALERTRGRARLLASEAIRRAEA